MTCSALQTMCKRSMLSAEDPLSAIGVPCNDFIPWAASVNRLVFMSIILHVDVLHFVQLGTASGGQVNATSAATQVPAALA